MFFKSNKKSDNQIEGFSHLGESLRFEGEIDCKGEIEIAGRVKGNIKAKKLKILETGSVNGVINAEEVEILGYMNGNVESVNIHIGAKACVRGQFSFENNLSILDGADISGRVRKAKKENIKKADTDKIKYLEHSKAS
jgi:cytoskeletal protein CcmA (bactofilin family)